MPDSRWRRRITATAARQASTAVHGDVAGGAKRHPQPPLARVAGVPFTAPPAPPAPPVIVTDVAPELEDEPPAVLVDDEPGVDSTPV